MATIFNRHLGTVYDLSGKMWTNRTASGELAICCPQCEAISELTDGHKVQRDGIVMPRWTCPSCSWRDFVWLGSHGEES